MSFKGLITIALGMGLTAGPALAGADFDTVRERGKVLCGVGGDIGTNVGKFQEEFCHAIAAAALGDAGRTEYVRLSAKRRFQALEEKAVDVLSRSVTRTLGRDAKLPFDFVGTVFYDGQGFAARNSLGAKRLADLKDATVCVETGTTTLANIKDYAKAHPGTISPLVFESFAVSRRAFLAGRCDLYSADSTWLLGFIHTENTRSDIDLMLLDDVISKEPLSLVVREGDPEWHDIVQWVYFATVEAEELGITSANAADLRENGSVAQRRFLGGTPGIGEALGLDDDWAFRVVRDVGNYGEIFERHLGEKSPYQLNRGLNALWTDGGLLYAPPFR